jgi:small subunit ribosomal protein S13
VEIGLRYIFGIGPTLSRQILEKTSVSPDTRVKDLSEDEIIRLRETIDREYKVEGDLRREVNLNIKRLVEIGCYRGLRHRRGLPAHGQRTRTNARTKRGPRRTVAGRRRATAKK